MMPLINYYNNIYLERFDNGPSYIPVITNQQSRTLADRKVVEKMRNITKDSRLQRTVQLYIVGSVQVLDKYISRQINNVYFRMLTKRKMIIMTVYQATQKLKLNGNKAYLLVIWTSSVQVKFETKLEFKYFMKQVYPALFCSSAFKITVETVVLESIVFSVEVTELPMVDFQSKTG